MLFETIKFFLEKNFFVLEKILFLEKKIFLKKICFENFLKKLFRKNFRKKNFFYLWRLKVTVRARMITLHLSYLINTFWKKYFGVVAIRPKYLSLGEN